MTARIIQIPPRGPFVVSVEPEEPGTWVVVTHRGHSWLHGSRTEANFEAVEIACGFGVLRKDGGIMTFISSTRRGKENSG